MTTDLEKNASDAAGRAKDAAGSFADDMKGKAQEFAAGAQETYGQVRDRVASATSGVSEPVQHYPLAAILAAGTLGCVLGLLLARR